MRRPLAVAAVLLLAACTGGGVTTEQAVLPTTTTTTVPPTTPRATAPSARPAPPASAPPTTSTDEEAPSTAPDGGVPPTAPDGGVPPTAPDGGVPPTVPDGGVPPTVAAGDPDEPSTSVGDRLFPDLGSADLDVQSYDLRLGYDVATHRIDATVTITTLLVRPLDVIALDAEALVVEGVTVDGSDATFEQTPTELLVHAASTVPAGRPVVVAVTYHDDQHAIDGPVAFGSGWFTAKDGSWVLNEPDGARAWLPSNDTPGDKATWHFELTVDTGLTAVANGHFVGEQPAGDGTTWVWDEPAPMATYMVQLLIGDYEILDGGTAGTTTLTNVALRDDVDRMQPYFDRTAEQIAFFEGFFGPYPFDHYGLAFAPSVGGLAMEMLGRSMFSRSDFNGQVDHGTELFQSHELAHQWFGDAVTPTRWEDLWLNESFATYGEWLWLDHTNLIDLDTTAAEVLAARQLPGDPTGAPSDAAALFGFDRYEGGAVVLHALRREIGDTAFFALLQRWVAQNTGTSRTTADFIALAEETAGRDLTAFFDDWLFARSLPATFPG
jgi:aminopeptidase N